MIKKQTGFSVNLRKLRKDLGMTQPEFSKKLGVSVYTICNYETASSVPHLSRIEEIIRLANELGKKYSYDNFLGLDLCNIDTLNQYSIYKKK